MINLHIERIQAIIVLALIIGFFIPLFIGGRLLWKNPKNYKNPVAWLCIVSGISGAFSGIPFWQEIIKHQYRTTLHEYHALSHINQRCKNTILEPPAQRIISEGVVLISDPHLSWLGHMDAQSLVDPARGLFQRVQVPTSTGLMEWSWLPDNRPWLNQQQRLGYPKEVKPGQPLQHALRIQSITTQEDRKYNVEGVEITIIERAQGTILARQIIYGRKKPHHPYIKICPSEPQTCPSPYCHAGLSFVSQSFLPIVTVPPKDIFHLYRGMPEPRHINCDSIHTEEILVAPGIDAQDIQWSLQEDRGVKSLRLQIKNTQDQIFCTNFLLPTIRLFNGQTIHIRRPGASSGSLHELPLTRRAPTPHAHSHQLGAGCVLGFSPRNKG